jgi:site-specific DNA recombinase
MDEQLRLLLERCEREGWEPEDFPDPARSGVRRDRPALGRLLARLEEFDYLVVWKLDRLSRAGAGHVSDVLERLLEHNVGLVSLTEPGFDGTPGMNWAMIEMAGVFARLEREHIRERVRASASPRVKRRRKPYGGGRRMYGRDRDYRVISREGEVIRQRIVAPTLRGQSELQIARALEADHVPGPGGDRWHAASIGKMLRRPHLVGDVVAPDGEVLRGALEPILDRKTWSELQALLAARRHGSERRGRNSAYAFLLDSPLEVICGDCGGPMGRVSGKPRKNGSFAPRYVCRTRTGKGTPACPRVPVDAAAVDQTLFRWMERGHIDMRETRRAVERAAHGVLEDARASLREAEREEMRRQAHLDKVERDYLDRDLPASDYSVLTAKLGVERETAAEEVRRLRARVAELESEGSLVDAQRATLRHLDDLRRAMHELRRAEQRDATDTVAAVRAALSRIVEAVIIGDPSRPQAVTNAIFSSEHVEGDTVTGVAQGIATGEGFTLLQIVPRRELARAGIVEAEGRSFPVLEPGEAPLQIPAENHAFRSQKTIVRPRRSTRSSS